MTSNPIRALVTALSINMKKNKDIPLSQEETNRVNRMKRRLLWVLIILDVALLIYLVYQIIFFLV